ncbi:acylphosphatase [Candidatus Bipolaricaulota bacterium]|nr:acylphosphatase [Candidatus Bipolaricaulota bacterium]TFH09859.1 MAG: acylphosphatase [Candidatus Atribacteria bacterium]
MIRLEAEVHGLVQGVFFRYSAQRQAQALGLTGHVENRPDGSVHVIAEGNRDALERLLQWLHKGPELANVTWVDASWSEPTDAFAGFTIRR